MVAQTSPPRGLSWGGGCSQRAAACRCIQHLLPVARRLTVSLNTTAAHGALPEPPPCRADRHAHATVWPPSAWSMSQLHDGILLVQALPKPLPSRRCWSWFRYVRSSLASRIVFQPRGLRFSLQHLLALLSPMAAKHRARSSSRFSLLCSSRTLPLCGACSFAAGASVQFRIGVAAYAAGAVGETLVEKPKPRSAVRFRVPCAQDESAARRRPLKQ